MTEQTVEGTLGELVTAEPAAARVFYRHGLDFCCGGKQSLGQACAAAGLDVDTVLSEIDDAKADGHGGLTSAGMPNHLRNSSTTSFGVTTFR